MSASTEKKNRQAARQAGTDKKMLAQQEAEKKAAKSRRRWTIGTIVVAILLVLIILLNSGFIYKHTPAARVGDRSYSPAELSYYYVNEYVDFINANGYYVSLLGLDPYQGIASLREQECSLLGEGATWRDYFLNSTLSTLKSTTALSDYAKANGIELDESELAAIEERLSNDVLTAQSYGYANVNNYYGAQYGSGVNARTVRGLLTDAILADKAVSQYRDSLTFTPEELEEYYASLNGEKDVFDFAYYFIEARKEPTAEGEGEGSATEETMTEAFYEADSVKDSFLDGYDIEDLTERLNAAIESRSDTDRATVVEGVAGSDLSIFVDWLKDASRVPGDIDVVRDDDAQGYYVVVFIGRDDNHYRTANVRHILIMAEQSEDGTWSDEAKQAAYDRILEIKAEFEAGDQSEESFAALAEKYSEDPGSNTVGGLYENVYKGRMVEGFDEFCFAGHEHGDIAVVYGSNGSSYAGYHLVYYVGEGELYSDVLARQDMVVEPVNEFIASCQEGYDATLTFWSRFST